MGRIRVPSVKCKGKSTRSGGPCKKFAIRGGEYCEIHGGQLPSIKAAAAARYEEMKAIEREARNPLRRAERRHPTVVMLDAMHSLDTIHQLAVATLDAGDEAVTPENLKRIADAAAQSLRASGAVFTARAEDAYTQSITRDATEVARVFINMLTDRDFGLTDEQIAWARSRLRREMLRLANQDNTDKKAITQG